jgi:biopolymer transport protein ExbD
VYLRADENVRYGKVIEVVDLLKRCGVERIGFAYEIPKEAS